MENIIDPDFDECLTEYRLQLPVEPISHYEEGELEAQWLNSAGFQQLTKPFERGLEVNTKDLEPILLTLPKTYAEAIKQRVYALNKTVRGRSKTRYKRKPDIRDVFRDLDDSSTGTRSRSATPDSLDSITVSEAWATTNAPEFVNVFDAADTHVAQKPKSKLKRTPSAPLRGAEDLFRGTHIRCDIPFHTAEGIELLGFNKIGTLHIPRSRSGSDPSCSVGRHAGAAIANSCSHNDLLAATAAESDLNSSMVASDVKKNESRLSNTSDSHKNSVKEPISFESIFNDTLQDVAEWNSAKEPCVDINLLSENDLKRLQPLLWLELAALFDKHKIILDKRKPHKRRRKEEGNLFGISLNALIRRDQQITGEDSTLVPIFLQGILSELTKRGAKEEGILRVAGHKQKTEILYNELESFFYQKPEKFAPLLSAANVHDLSALLKRWIRELPQPLLASNLVQLFYQANALPSPDQFQALCIICLLMPAENRNTLRSLLLFLNYVIDEQQCNKMTRHNVATIMAPSFFPPRLIHPIDKDNIEEQVKMAAQCCHLTNTLIIHGEDLFMVPKRLTEQSKLIKIRNNKKPSHKQSALEGSSRTTTDSKNHVYRLVV